MTLGPYLKRIPGRTGIYFQRAVPRPLHQRLGKKTWQFKAGNTVAEARRAVQGLMLRTDAEIAAATGVVNAGLLAEIDGKPVYGVKADLQEQGLSPEDIYPQHSPEQAHSLVERQHRREQGLPYAERTWEGLLDLCIKLKQPAPSTINEWRRRTDEMVRITGVADPSQVTEDHARKYRDYHLDTVANTTLKTRIRYIRALLEVALSEQWVTSNPFNCIKLRFIKGTSKKKEVVKLEGIDDKVKEGALPPHHEALYWIVRYTGTHVSEAAGIQFKDLDLANGVIHISPNDLRPLKNEYRQRDLPMLDELKEALKGLDVSTHSPDAHVFPGLYNDKTQRWGYGLQWDRRLGITPKVCRDVVATTLRDADVNERVLGSILGHTPTNSTGLYGSVSMDAKKKALSKLIISQ